MKPVTLGNRGIRFHPEVPGSLEPMSGGGQFGLAHQRHRMGAAMFLHPAQQGRHHAA